MISIVCPFYNEEKTISEFFERIIPVMRSMAMPFEIICVDDGSQDTTLEQLLAMQSKYAETVVLELSRNFGKEAALTAGIDQACGQGIIPIDADLQDPPELIPRLVEKWQEGFDVVLARRVDRSSDHWLKRSSAQLFYDIHNKISDDIPLPYNVGDFRLMDQRVVEAVKRLPERRRFMKGIFAWVGFRTTYVDYVRDTRSAGHSKFNGWRLWNFALEGITAHSTVLLRIWTYFGAIVASLAFFYGSFIILRTLIFGVDLPGYASLLTVVLFMGGIQLIGMGMLGEYLGRTYTESKQRPVYLIRKVHNTSC